MSSVWHSMSEEEVLRTLKTSRNGLSSEEAKRRLLEYGPNQLISKGGIHPLRILLNQFKDIFVLMLLAAIAISIAMVLSKPEPPTIEDYADPLTIGVIVALNAIVGFVQEYRSEKAIEAMRKLTAPKATVIRDGRSVVIPAEEVVPGDILVLETGDRVAADARVIEAIELKTNEAVLTGESTPVDKTLGVLPENTPVSDRRNMVFMATHVIYGRGRAVVTSTGMKTEFGKIAELVQEMEEEETPLKRKLERFAKKLGVIVVVVCIIVFILELIDIYIYKVSGTESIMDAFFTAVALAVSAVPEGLPAVVTVTLALGARELAKRNAIIRRLSSTETLGSVTVICSDKTGTLTKGEMTVRKIYVNGKIIEVTGVGYEAKGEFLQGDDEIDVKNDSDLSLLLTGSALCTNAQYDGKNIIGDSTEGALIVAAAKAGFLKDELEKVYPRIYEVPFTSERKRMTTVHKSTDGKLIAFMKGAPEIVLQRCTHILRNGKPEKLGEKDRREILSINEQMANEALRVLGVAYKELGNLSKKSLNKKEIPKMVENQLIFVGLLGMIDPPREEAKIANQQCQKAGIKTIMITGDHKLTAVAIAKEIGIMQEGDLALTGEELDKMSDEEFESIVEKVRVYARVSPEHKLRIVRALKKKGHIVAMTGDGVNDAPALKQADIGIAMGITGTDVTKEAADMILADDNFATIVKAVEGGRAIYDNIRKFTFFLMRCNFDELFLIGTFALLGLELPLTAGMILWINLVTDGGPALALTMDPPAEDVMDRPPRNPNEGILHGRLASIIATFTLQFLLTGGLFYWQYYMLPGPLTPHKLAEARTMAFVRATLQELFVVWNCRSEKRGAFRLNPLTNKYLVVAVVVSAIATILVPVFGIFGTVWLDDPFEWTITILASLSGLFILPEIFYGRKIWRWT
ncbi:cation-translocating P-type ATPase [Candidatus Bathyarchaeota archaeon]|nr:cation-translocating P-type ATPase [Candidatus Bathyarchaeota archaeon]